MTPVFATVPSIFTKTAIEGVIQAHGFAAQSTVAAVLRGTPVLVAVGALAWSYAAYKAIVAMTVEGRAPQAALYRLFVVTLTMGLGWTLLGFETANGITSGPIDASGLDQQWSELPGVVASPKYEKLQTPTNALWWFSRINAAYEECSALLTSAVGVTPQEDPAEMVRSLIKLQATTLGTTNGGGQVLTAFDALARNCGRSDARVLEPGAPLQDLFTTTVSVIGTDAAGNAIDCAQLWTDFEEATASVAADLHQEDDPGAAGLLSRFGWQRFLSLGAEWFLLEEDETAQWATNALIEGTVRDAAKRSASGLNPLRKDEATFSEGWPDYIVDILVDGGVGEVALNAGSIFDPNLHLRAQKAEAAKRFNEIADLIPTMRGFLFAAFAVAFPLCAYGLALGLTAPMRNWLVGRGVLALYMPAAHLLYAMVDEFAGYNAIAENPEYAWLYSQQAVVGALSIMEAETLRVQTAYLICEVAVFSAFALGSARSLLVGGFSTSGTGAMGFATGLSTAVGGGWMVHRMLTAMSNGKSMFGGGSAASGAAAGASGAAVAAASSAGAAVVAVPIVATVARAAASRTATTPLTTTGARIGPSIAGEPLRRF